MKSNYLTESRFFFLLFLMGIVNEHNWELDESPVPFLFKNRAKEKNMNVCGGYSEKKTAGGVPAEFWLSHHFSDDNISRPHVNRAAPARIANWPFSRLLTVVLTRIDLVRTERNDSFIPVKLRNSTRTFISVN